MLNLYVQPGASNSAFVGVRDQAIKLRVRAQPQDGQANKEVESYVAKFFGVPKSMVNIHHGHTSRNKTVLIQGETQMLLSKAQVLLRESS